MQLSIIIVNYNVKHFVEQCLYTVINACKNIEAEIIVVDNNSTDGSKDFFINKFAGVHFMWNKENEGFSKANNLALQQATGKYILFLNPDTIIPEDCFEKCLHFFETKNDIGALGIRMIDGAGNFLKESKRGFPTLITSFFKLSGLATLFPNSPIFNLYYLGNLAENKNQEVDVLAGAFMMVTKKLLDKTGSFDNDFFMYGEDIDLSYRIKKAGYKNYYFSESTIIHFKGESTKKDNLQYILLFYGAMHHFVKKHNSRAKAFLYGIFIHMAILLKMIAAFIKKRFGKAEKNRNRIFYNPLSALIVAGYEEYQPIIELLKRADAQLKVIGRVNIGEELSSESLGNLHDLPELIDRDAIENIIFCINEFSAKEVIDIIQSIDKPVNFSFHAAGSCSIVGSNNKNETGVYIAAN